MFGITFGLVQDTVHQLISVLQSISMNSLSYSQYSCDRSSVPRRIYSDSTTEVSPRLQSLELSS